MPQSPKLVHNPRLFVSQSSFTAPSSFSMHQQLSLQSQSKPPSILFSYLTKHQSSASWHIVLFSSSQNLNPGAYFGTQEAPTGFAVTFNARNTPPVSNASIVASAFVINELP